MSGDRGDLVIVGAGPVGLMCAYLAHLRGLSAIVLDRSSGPLEVGRADALNARTLQLLEVVGLFDELYPNGKTCNTSSIWSEGRFVSRQSQWWDELQGCLHKHFLMIGQAQVERLLDEKLREAGASVRRRAEIVDVRLEGDDCLTTLSNGETLRSRYVIGADGSRSFVRERFQIPFEITRPRIVWAVIDGVIDTDFPKAPEIVVFQAETADVAWIPREGAIDRFYVRMDRKEFSLEDAVAKINRAMRPHSLRFSEIAWFSRFSVKESVAESFSIHDRVFLAGDACHVHSVNGGQGLNTGLADAFNLIWKLSAVMREEAPADFLRTYELERKPVALSVIEASGELVRSTRDSSAGTHAEDYVAIVKKRAGNITGMGIRYGDDELVGTRLFDFALERGAERTRLYSLLDYRRHTLLVFGHASPESISGLDLPPATQVIRIRPEKTDSDFSAAESAIPDLRYAGQAILVRPDAYIAAATPLAQAKWPQSEKFSWFRSAKRSRSFFNTHLRRVALSSLKKTSSLRKTRQFS